MGLLRRELCGSINYRQIGLFSKNALWDEWGLLKKENKDILAISIINYIII